MGLGLGLGLGIGLGLVALNVTKVRSFSNQSLL